MKIFEAAPPGEGPSLALHGGAGGRLEELALERHAPYREGLIAAFSAGWRVLASGGSALDAVCASVEVLENDPLFNAGRGAALTATGHAELDASVMTGAGLAGAENERFAAMLAANGLTDLLLGESEFRVALRTMDLQHGDFLEGSTDRQAVKNLAL